MQIKKQDIKQLPLHELGDMESQQEVENWCEQHELYNHHTWLLPQMVAHFGNWQLYTSEGKPDPKQILKANLNTSWDRGLWWLTRIRRSQLIKQQVKNTQYAQFTPLIMLGFKRHQGIPYSRWQGVQGLRHILEPELYTALVVEGVEDLVGLGSDRLLQLRVQGLTQKGGLKKGTMKPAESTWQLTGIKDTEIFHLPKFTQTILTQIWLAHPKHRHSDMILDLENWDRMPKPLLDQEIFVQPQMPKKHKPVAEPLDLPWL